MDGSPLHVAMQMYVTSDMHNRMIVYAIESYIVIQRIYNLISGVPRRGLGGFKPSPKF
jgi:hypothetical protein